MGRERKTYLDLFLDNSLAKKKEKGIYFGEEHEAAILAYNDENTTNRARGVLYEELIGPAYKRIISGVMEMPKFRRLPRGLDREQLSEETLNRLIEKTNKFTPEMIGKSGQPVKAFSYFSTIAKNFILEKKVRHEKVLKNKADVESSIDLSILSEDTLVKMSNYDVVNVSLDDYEITFNNTRIHVLNAIQEFITLEESKIKKDEGLIKIGYCLKYLLEKWDKIEFMKKNEFMRILTLYTGLKQQQVSFLFKKYKTAVFKKISMNQVNKNMKFIDFEDEKEDLIIETEFDDTEFDDTEFEVQLEEMVMPDGWEITSMEEYEKQIEYNDNKKIKDDLKEFNKVEDVENIENE